jgi:NAD(P)-dependent dehydrogenase (short-subunit alcohol dehydrogenase family)
MALSTSTSFCRIIEIAKLVSFLLSENNSYITGQTIIIDGGFLA